MAIFSRFLTILTVFFCFFSLVGPTTVSAQSNSALKLNQIQFGYCNPLHFIQGQSVTCFFPVTAGVTTGYQTSNIIAGLRNENGDITYEGPICTLITENNKVLLKCTFKTQYIAQSAPNTNTFNWQISTYQHDVAFIDLNTYREINDTQKTYDEVTTMAFVSPTAFYSPYSAWRSTYDVQSRTEADVVEFKGVLYHTYVDANFKVQTRFSTNPIFQGINGSTEPYSLVWSTPYWSNNQFEYTAKTVNMAVFKDKLYQVATGSDNRVWTRFSADGKNFSDWDREESSSSEYTNFAVAMAVANNKLYQSAVGSDNRVWTRSSDDGINFNSWKTSSALGEYTNHTIDMSSRGNTLYQVTVGNDNKVWSRSSTNGIDWSDWNRNFSLASEYTNYTVKMTIDQTTGKIYQSAIGRDYRLVWVRESTNPNDINSWGPWIHTGGYSSTPSDILKVNNRLFQMHNNNDGYQFWRATNHQFI
jgi:hypothetical protein